MKYTTKVQQQQIKKLRKYKYLRTIINETNEYDI